MFKIFLISTIFTLWYAWNRSMHDKYLFGTSEYKWHWWALVEAVILNTVFIIGLYFFHMQVFGLMLIPQFKFAALWFANAFLFWMVFDMLMGYHAKRDIWYIGVKGFDAQIRKIFLYDIMKGKVYFVVKLIAYISIVCGLYFNVGLNELFDLFK